MMLKPHLVPEKRGECWTVQVYSKRDSPYNLTQRVFIGRRGAPLGALLRGIRDMPAVEWLPDWFNLRGRR